MSSVVDAIRFLSNMLSCRKIFFILKWCVLLCCCMRNDIPWKFMWIYLNAPEIEYFLQKSLTLGKFFLCISFIHSFSYAVCSIQLWMSAYFLIHSFIRCGCMSFNLCHKMYTYITYNGNKVYADCRCKLLFTIWVHHDKKKMKNEEKLTWVIIEDDVYTWCWMLKRIFVNENYWLRGWQTKCSAKNILDVVECAWNQWILQFYSGHTTNEYTVQ